MNPSPDSQLLPLAIMRACGHKTLTPWPIDVAPDTFLPERTGTPSGIWSMPLFPWILPADDSDTTPRWLNIHIAHLQGFARWEERWGCIRVFARAGEGYITVGRHTFSAPATSMQHPTTPPNPQTPLLFKPPGSLDRGQPRYSPVGAGNGGTPERPRPFLSRSGSSVQPAPECTDTQDSRGVSLVLENTGSVARDHLASERTFLAYVRTSLTVASAGVALAQLLSLSERLETGLFVPLNTYARPLAVSMLVLALYILFVGVSRYFAIQDALTKGLFPVVRVRVGILVLGLAAIVALLFGLLLLEGSSPR
ncbi:hypothetical protein C8R46DRAFT_1344616 [Mycena filopes]|nr:hypothetical protein C8R46DRAFT_1344616 [Mycena filopes]